MVDRHAEVAPRGCGKSSWWFLFLPLWAAAYGHLKFVAAFAHSAAQSEQHLSTFKNELDTNALLRHDFPELCEPARRQTGATVADRQGMLHTRSGFTFASRGMDSANLGMKVGASRPDCLILDDVEPDESSYSPYLAQKRLTTLVDAVLALNIYARVILVGTVTMPGSIVHQLVKAANGEDHETWIDDEQFQAHHYRAIATDDDGVERSIWPEKWPLSWLQSRRGTREYAKNYDNDPHGVDGGYWSKGDFQYGTLVAATRTALVIDPAVTSGPKSDRSGLAVVSYSPSEGRCVVEHASGVRLSGKDLRRRVLELLVEFPAVRVVRVESNQGGDLWGEILHDLPGVRLRTHFSSESKEVRFARVLDHYQRGRVLHVGRLHALETEMMGFPRAAHDDVADAVCAGVEGFLAPPIRRQAPRSAAYV